MKTDRSAETCPCGKSNKDGKYVIFKNKGSLCFSCGKSFYLEGATPYERESDDEPKESMYVGKEIVLATNTYYEKNTLVQYWIDLYGKERVMQSVKDYFVGTTKEGWTLFWQIDRRGSARKAQKIEYKPDGHRTGREYYVGGYTNKKGYYGCLFGEHMIHLNPSIKTIGLVESEKSAAIAWMYYKDKIWMATGGASGLSHDKCFALHGYNVVIYPDCDEPGRNGAVNWVARLKEHGIDSVILDLDPSRNDGADIADLIEEEILMDRDKRYELKNYPDSLKQLIESNPLVQKLIDKLDLEVASTTSIDLSEEIGIKS